MSAISPEANLLSPLAELQVFLHQSGFSTFLSDRDEGEAVEQLLVDLRDEAGLRPLVAHLVWLEDLEAEIRRVAGREQAEAEAVWHLEILVHLPLECPPEKLPELQLLALWLSAQLPFGAYSADPRQGLCFRHVLLSEDQRDQQMLILETLELCPPGIKQHLPRFAALAAGKASPEQAREGVPK